MSGKPICDACGQVLVDQIPTRVTITPPCGHAVDKIVCADCAAQITRRFRRPRRLGPAPAEQAAAGDHFVAVAMPGD
jgi:hypothetical protein